MKYYEIAILEDNQRQLFRFVTTNQFMKDYLRFRKKYDRLDAEMNAFTQCREFHLPHECNGGTPMKGVPGGSQILHYHLVHGDAVILYQYDNNEIRLLAIGPHKMYDENASKRLFKRTTRIDPAAFHAWVMPQSEAKPKPESTPLTPQETSEVKGLLKQFTTDRDYRYIIEELAQGQIESFMWMARIAVGLDSKDSSRDGDIIGAFGGRSALIQRAEAWIKSSDERGQLTSRWLAQRAQKRPSARPASVARPA